MLAEILNKVKMMENHKSYKTMKDLNKKRCKKITKSKTVDKISTSKENLSCVNEDIVNTIQMAKMCITEQLC